MNLNKNLFSLSLLSASVLLTGNTWAVDESQKLVHGTNDVKQGHLNSADTYVQVFEYGENIGISYGLFYPHNGDIFLSEGSGGTTGDAFCWLFPAICAGVDLVAGDEGVHEADWENIKVIINKDSGQVVDVYISAHVGEGGWFPLSSYDTESGRPVVYSARHSHANYRTQGLQARIEETYGVANDLTDRGPLWALKDHISLIGGDYGTNNLYPWLEYSGRWGATWNEGFSNTNSPGGRKFSKSWFVNWVEDHQNVDISSSDVRDLVKHDYADAGQLAYDYAPKVYLHSDDTYMPSSISWYLDRVKLSINNSVTLDVGEVNPWSVAGKSAPLLRDLSLFSRHHGHIEATNDKHNGQNVWRISTAGDDGYLQNINAGVTFTPDNKVYEFSVDLKAPAGSTQLVTLRLRDKAQENIVEQDFVVTDQWQRYAVNQSFPGTHTGLSMFIYPAGKVDGNNGEVYAADAQLNRISTYTKSLVGLKWTRSNARPGAGLCAQDGELLPAGVVSDECEQNGKFYHWDEAQGACPVGYRLPTLSEYLALFDATGGASGSAGRQLKSVGFGNGTNDHNFDAIPTGYINPGSITLNNHDSGTYFWTSDENTTDNTLAARIYISANNSQINNSPDYYAWQDKNKRYSVRCVK